MSSLGVGWGRQRVAWTERPGEGWEDMSAPASQKAMGRLGCAWQVGPDPSRKEWWGLPGRGCSSGGRGVCSGLTPLQPLIGSQKCFPAHSSSRPLSGYPGALCPQAGHPQATGVPACQPVTSLACKVWSTWNLGCGRQGVEADDPANVNDAVEAMVLRGGVQ